MKNYSNTQKRCVIIYKQKIPFTHKKMNKYSKIPFIHKKMNKLVSAIRGCVWHNFTIHIHSVFENIEHPHLRFWLTLDVGLGLVRN